MLRIYYADISALPEDTGALLLSDYRLKRLSASRLAHRHRQGLGAELLLIHALRSLNDAAALPLSINTLSDGKPVLADASIHFSLSHSENTAACAICDSPVGIDLEADRPLHDSILQRCFSEQEQEWILRSTDPSAAFTEAWTGKESYLKATGEGLRALNTISSLSFPRNAAFFHTRLDGLHLSVCVLDGSAAPELLEKVDLLTKPFLYSDEL